MHDPQLSIRAGDTIDLVLEGQVARGEVLEATPEKLVVRVSIRQPALTHEGLIGRATLGDGREIKFDLGKCGHYVALEVEIPLQQAQPQEEAPAVDRRRFFRLGMELDLDIIDAFSLGGSGRTFGSEIVRARGKTVNVSGGGLLAAMDQPLLPGLYTMRLYLPGEAITVSAKVIRKPLASPVLTAIEFVGIHEMDRSKIIRLIFNKMRHVKATSANANAEKPHKKKDEPTRHQLRREKYFSPPKIRYW